MPIIEVFCGERSSRSILLRRVGRDVAEDLGQKAGVLRQAKHVTFHAAGGTYNDNLPLELVRDPQTVLADTLGDEPLPPAHGGPLRLVVPDQLAYKSVKWVERIEVTDEAVEGYCEERGYPIDAPVT